MKKLYYIKERINPQLGTYYVAMGQMSKTAAKKYEKPSYGYNIMHSFLTEALYTAELTRLKSTGERVQ